MPAVLTEELFFPALRRSLGGGGSRQSPRFEILDVEEATGAPRLTATDAFGSESRNGLLCAGDPVNKSDPSGLVDRPAVVQNRGATATAQGVVVTGTALTGSGSPLTSAGGGDWQPVGLGGLNFLGVGGGRGGGSRTATVTRTRDSNQLGTSPGAPFATQGFWTDPNGFPTGTSWVTTLTVTSEIQQGFQAGIKSLQSVSFNWFGKIVGHMASIGSTNLPTGQYFGSGTFSATVSGSFSEYNVNMTGAAQSAFLPERFAINYNFNIAVDISGRTAVLSGTHDGYPSYGVTANGRSLYNWSERSFWDLRPGMEVNASGSTHW